MKVRLGIAFACGADLEVGSWRGKAARMSTDAPPAFKRPSVRADIVVIGSTMKPMNDGR